LRQLGNRTSTIALCRRRDNRAEPFAALSAPLDNVVEYRRSKALFPDTIFGNKDAGILLRAVKFVLYFCTSIQRRQEGCEARRTSMRCYQTRGRAVVLRKVGNWHPDAGIRTACGLPRTSVLGAER
jgi:hypothetical protein